jgi:hypothetical protein
MEMDIRKFEGQIITILVDGRRICGRLDGIEGGAILVGDWRILMSRVSAWTTGVADTQADTVITL